MSDCISRDAAMEIVKRTSGDYAAAFSEIRKLPAADVEPVRRGRWISWEKADNCVPSPDRHECSVCHDAAQVLANGLELLSFYCPNCGAKMCLEGEIDD